MSLITLIDTHNLVHSSINSLRSINDIISYSDTTPLHKMDNKKILKNMFELQYNVIYTYYNKNSFDLTGIPGFIKIDDKIDLEVKFNIMNRFYQHQYLHNNAAIFDEYFELRDARNKYNKKINDIGDTYKNVLLIFEEAIDVMHFALEYGCLFAEQQLLINDERYLSDFPNCIYNNENFKTAVLSKLQALVDDIDVDGYYAYNADTSFDIMLDDILVLTRDILRLVAFKDWKKYTKDFYTAERFKNLYTKVFILISKIFNIINIQFYDDCHTLNKFGNGSLEYVKSLFSDVTVIQNNFTDNLILTVDQDNSPIISVAEDYSNFISSFNKYFVYGCYVAKNWINVQRQTEDPRYTGKDFGNIIGVSV